MFSAPSKNRRSADPSFDLAYSVEDFPNDPHRDSRFLNERIRRSMLDEGVVPGGRTLDVACGVGHLPVGITQNGGQGWGLEPSKEMLGVSRWLYPADQAVLVRGVAEELPFRDGTFDRVICQGALDHFVAPKAFMAEAARILRPNGRVVIALTNYESVSCRLGRLLDRFAIEILRRPRPPDRPYYQPPPDHHHKGDLPFVRSLGGARLSLVRCYGLSLLWLLRGRGELSWGRLLDTAPEPAASLLLRSLDTCAYSLPSQADMIVSVWRRRPAGP